MRKIFHFIIMTTLLLVVSCSGENMSSESNRLVIFQVILEDTGETSRSVSCNGTDVELGTGAWVNQLIYAVYETGKSERIMQQVVEMRNGIALVEVPLVNGVEYDIVFFAYNGSNNIFDITSPLIADLTNLTIRNQLFANQEAYDAFFHVEKAYKAQNNTLKPVMLRRPFAQLNVGTTKMDLDEVKSLQSVIFQSKIVLEDVPTKFNARTGQASAEQPVEYSIYDILTCSALEEGELHINEKLDIGNNFYYYLGMSYVLAHEESSMCDASVIFYQENEVVATTLTIPHLPLQRNYRTNVTGNILTKQESFEISLDTGIGVSRPID